MLTVRKYRIALLAAVFILLTLYFFADTSRGYVRDQIDVIRKVSHQKAPSPDAVDGDGHTRFPKPVQAEPEIPVAPKKVTEDDLPQAQPEPPPPRAKGENVVVPDMDATLPTRPNLKLHEDEDKDKQDPLAGDAKSGNKKASKTNKPAKPGKQRYPIAAKDLIKLPVGETKPLPKIQFSFDAETPSEKADRVKKQEIVLGSFKHAWGGYKKYAMGCDELKPLSKSCANQTQFMGWGATLIDTLDTLWIMGLWDEFENAVKEVEKVDFKTSTSERIPVFETTIRYLGGLLSAYDLSSGKYPILLEKATELAEVLMGAFDTPNRMPIPYYHWAGTDDPDYLMSSRRTVLAEIGSLSMEFTRLAQLTKKDKYYDAIARITNALQKWQSDTRMPGLFPLRLDSSGCKYKPTSFKNKAKSAVDQSSKQDPKSAWEKVFSTRDETAGVGPEEISDKKVLAKRDYDDALEVPAKKKSQSGDMDCEPQGLRHEPNPKDGKINFGIGGLADSVYEYMPKMHSLLGGVNGQYRSMYDYAMKAITDTLLFRPMIPDEKRSILFAARQEFDAKDADGGKMTIWEATHLTCFAGGMVALASKVFDKPKDLEIARRLTDGCIWAYESTPVKVMPETFNVMPCDSQSECPWDEKRWHQFLDLGMQERFDAVEAFNKHQEKLYGGKATSKLTSDEKESKAKSNDEKTGGKKYNSGGAPKSDDVIRKTDDEIVDPSKSLKLAADKPLKLLDDDERKVDKKVEEAVDIQRVPKKLTMADTEEAHEPPSGPLHRRADDDSDEISTQKKSGKPSKASSYLFEDDEVDSAAQPLTYKPKVAMSHEKYIQAVLQESRYPPSYTSIFDRAYKLRPEAIESVFIMWRITGDKYWREKGWQMFEAIQAATRTEVGNAALLDVTSILEPKKDSMESFWLAETLKYFYLLFSETNVISLDEYVFNTEAHPFKLPK